MAYDSRHILTAREWDSEAMDFVPVILGELNRKDLLKYAKEAQDFIFKTMAVMELRPKRSHVRAVRNENGGTLYWIP